MSDNCFSRISRTVSGFEWIVDGKPFTAFSGECHNSSSSSPGYMRERVWPAARQMNLNTVIVPVSWELCEPEEGCFDFSVVEELIDDARINGMNLILLWFGAWKNTYSTYVPGWVKQDRKRFPPAFNAPGVSRDPLTLTLFNDELRQSDARAFANLMNFLKAKDSEFHTVLMMQIENECGMLGSSRDHSPEAEKAFKQPVPPDLLDGLQKFAILRPEQNDWKQGTTWTDCFGKTADEIFSAWHFAGYCQSVAEAGCREYDLPCYVNAWLVPDRIDSGAGYGYPSGGPSTKMKNIWHIAAPDLVLIAPDIYSSNFRHSCDEYTLPDNPLFIPETHRNDTAVQNCLYAIGQGALCFAPFGFEDMITNQNSVIVGNAVVDECIERRNHDCGYSLGQTYSVLRNMEHVIHEANRTGMSRGYLQLTGVMFEYIEVGGITFSIRYKKQMQPDTSAGAGAIFKCGNEWYAAGINSMIKPENAELDFIEEGHFENGTWIRGRRLNGDEYGVFFQEQTAVLKFKITEILQKG